MKLSEATVDYLHSVLETAHFIGIESLILETGRIRGISEDQTILIIHDDNIPEFEFETMGLSRTDILTYRLSATKRYASFSVKVNVHPEKNFVADVVMTAQRTRSTYKCMNPSHISAPRVVADSMFSEFEYNLDLHDDIKRGVQAMGNVETVSFVSDDEGVKFVMEDLNGDVFEHTFGECINDKFSHKYPTKNILSLLKKTPEGVFEVGKKGVLRVMVGGLSVYLLPRI